MKIVPSNHEELFRLVRTEESAAAVGEGLGAAADAAAGAGGQHDVGAGLVLDQRAAGDAVAAVGDVAGRADVEDGDAEAGGGGAAGHLETLELLDRAGLDPGALEQRQHVIAGLRQVEQQQGVFAQFGEGDFRAHGERVGLRHHHMRRGVVEHLRIELLPEAGVIGQQHVYNAVAQILLDLDQVTLDQVDDQVGMAVLQVADDLRRDVRRDRGEGADAQLAGDPAVAAGQFLLERLRLVEQPDGACDGPLAARGGHQPLGALADEQLDAEFLLETVDGAEDRGGRDVQAGRRTADRPLAGGGDDIAELAER